MNESHTIISIGDWVFEYWNKPVIFGAAGPYAEEYAKENNIWFVAIPMIQKGQTNTTYVKGSSEGAVIKCSGEYADFLCVSVDGKPIDGKYYTIEKGSTIITFTQEFMDTLEVGGLLGDVDRDGLITTDDALEILNNVAGIASLIFPAR